jgi:catalase (peroxidase I)
MRYELEANDDANAGLGIARDLLIPVEKSHPHVSVSDVWALAGAAAVEKTGGPKVPVGLGRVDQTDGTKCPPNGRLPDASQGAQHLRDVFYRMGFNDQEIVVLSGAHTLGRCHQVSRQ